MENTIIRLISVQLNNFKNIKQGTITLNKNKEKDFNFSSADVLGIYGQNGSGKTAVIQVIDIFQRIAIGRELIKDIDNLVKINEKECSFAFKFALKIENEKKYLISYCCSISKELKRLTKEKLMVSKLQEDGNWSKMSPYFECNYDDDIKVFEPLFRYNNVVNNNQDNIIKLSVALKLAQENRISFLFSENLINIIKDSKESELYYLISILKKYARENIFTISNSHNGVISLNAFLPLTVFHNINDVTFFGDIPIELQHPMETNEKYFNLISSVIKNMNGVVEAIVPGLSFEVKSYGKQMLKDGSSGIRYEILSNRYGSTFPLRYESEGIKRLFSELNVLIAMYNNSSILVAIDELDAGIFESLLGTLIHVISETGKGQLIFTSHNLRPLEMLDKENIMFSTTNENNRYIRMANIKDSNNLRDCYIRALSLGGQQEELGQEIKESAIRRAFRHAGGR